MPKKRQVNGETATGNAVKVRALRLENRNFTKERAAKQQELAAKQQERAAKQQERVAKECKLADDGRDLCSGEKKATGTGEFESSMITTKKKFPVYVKRILPLYNNQQTSCFMINPQKMLTTLMSFYCEFESLDASKTNFFLVLKSTDKGTDPILKEGATLVVRTGESEQMRERVRDADAVADGNSGESREQKLLSDAIPQAPIELEPDREIIVSVKQRGFNTFYCHMQPRETLHCLMETYCRFHSLDETSVQFLLELKHTDTHILIDGATLHVCTV
jgi:hypothetical protein